MKTPLACKVSSALAHLPMTGFYEKLVWVGLSGLGYHNWVAGSNGEDRWLKRWLADGHPYNLVIFDVGANEGEFTDVVLKGNPADEVHMFEPNPPTVERLTKKYAHCHRVHLNGVGLSDETGQMSLFDVAGSEGTDLATAFPEAITDWYGKPASQVTVPVTTLDAYCKDIPRIDYLKVDVEGLEGRVLAGASRMISEGRIGVVQLEVNGHWLLDDLSIARVLRLLPGYSCWRISPRGLLPVSTKARPYRTGQDINRYSNIVLMKESGDL